MNTLNKELSTIVLGLAGTKLDGSCYIERGHLSPEVWPEFDALHKLLGTDKIFGLYPSKDGPKLNLPRIVLNMATNKMGLATVGGILPISAKNVTVSTDGSQVNFEGTADGDEEAEFYSLTVSAAIKQGQKGVLGLRDLQNAAATVLSPGGVTPPMTVEGKLEGLSTVVYKEGTPEEFTSYLINLGGYQFGLGKGIASVWSKLAVGVQCVYDGNTFKFGDTLVQLRGTPKASEMPDGTYAIKGVHQETVKGKESTWLQGYAILENGECRIKPAMYRMIVQLLDGDNLELVVSEGVESIKLTKDVESIAARFAGKFKVSAE